MTKSIVSIILLFMSLTAAAQELRVKSFAPLPTDLTARKQPRQDLNGRQCALLKVQVMDDITGCNGVNLGEIESNGILKLIYVPSVTRSIKFNFKSHFSLSVVFADYGVTALEQGVVYELKLASTSGFNLTNDNVAENGLSVAGISNQIIANIIKNMVNIKGGTLYTEEKGKSKTVTVSDFMIGKYEVTQEEWKTVMGNNPSFFKGDSLPVENVRESDCRMFIEKLNKITGLKFRLPAKYEWEYAAKGGSHSHGYDYAGSNDVDKVAWYKKNSENRTHAVGLKTPNELGLYDMSGNVFELCNQSVFNSDLVGASAISIRLVKGGSWFHDNGSCRVCKSGGANKAEAFVGLRLAL